MYKTCYAGSELITWIRMYVIKKSKNIFILILKISYGTS